jgi:peptidoglycan/xylan/chitin deacetylase (PgdA/CDA1 family)
MITVARPPYLLRKVFSRCIWRMPDTEKNVYLTFDDGPVPVITEWVLDLLKLENIKATFFCVGENVEKHPEIYARILREGHAVGNHTFNHIKGLSTSNPQYYKNVQQCRKYIQSDLFRPPYGQLKTSQQDRLSRQYQIIMWDVLSYDYSSAVSPERCLENVTKNVRNGSIIVFHDSVKAFPNLESALPKSIAYMKENGFSFSLFSPESR